MLAHNYGGCWVCGNRPTTKRLHVDHDHRIANAKIIVHKIDNFDKIHVYRATCLVTNDVAFGNNKILLRKEFKKILLRKSVRGLLCWPCNRALRMFYDNPEKMEKAAQYLRNYRRTKLGELIPEEAFQKQKFETMANNEKVRREIMNETANS